LLKAAEALILALLLGLMKAPAASLLLLEAVGLVDLL
jgi:hypothetical protein